MRNQKGLPYGYILTKIFRHCNVTLIDEAYLTTTESKNVISSKNVNRKMGVLCNKQEKINSYLDDVFLPQEDEDEDDEGEEDEP